jgi:hypothetical protein
VKKTVEYDKQRRNMGEKRRNNRTARKEEKAEEGFPGFLASEIGIYVGPSSAFHYAS